MMKRMITSDRNGMTLIELIVAMLVFSIAAMIASSGLLRAFQFMKEGNDIKKTSDTLQMTMSKKTLDEAEQANVTEITNARITYTLADGTTWDVTGNARRMEQSYTEQSSLRLALFDVMHKPVSNRNEEKAQQLYEMVEGWDLAWATSMQRTEAERIVQITMPHTVFTANNDIYRTYLYYGVFAKAYMQPEGTWIPLDFSDIAEDIVALQQGQWYLKVYFNAPVLRDRILYADSLQASITSGWEDKKLFYIPAGPGESTGNWYYGKTPTAQYTLSDFSVDADHTKPRIDWNEAKDTIIHSEDWVKITY